MSLQHARHPAVHSCASHSTIQHHTRTLAQSTLRTVKKHNAWRVVPRHGKVKVSGLPFEVDGTDGQSASKHVDHFHRQVKSRRRRVKANAYVCRTCEAHKHTVRTTHAQTRTCTQAHRHTRNESKHTCKVPGLTSPSQDPVKQQHQQRRVLTAQDVGSAADLVGAGSLQS